LKAVKGTVQNWIGEQPAIARGHQKDSGEQKINPKKRIHMNPKDP